MMRHDRRNGGFTLVELLITILAASLITAAATTVLLVGMRINQKANSSSSQQNSVSMGMTILEDLAAEKCVKTTGNDAAWNALDADGNVIFSYQDKTIYIGSATPFISNVSTSTAEMSDNLLTIEMTVDGKDYQTVVYCRTAASANATTPMSTEQSEESEPEAAAKTAASVQSGSMQPQTLSKVATFSARARQAFLDILIAEEGSTGLSTTGEYYSEWYIGSYEENPAWNEETPWCACFISWALAQCEDYLRSVPRYAHVDKFMASFDKSHWKTASPQPGDIIFFDWIVDEETRPQHVGVVTGTDGEYVYTIEGNVNGTVAACSYKLSAPCILGYGELQWK